MTICILVLLVAACSSASEEQDEPSTTTEDPGTTSPTPTTSLPRPTVAPDRQDDRPAGVFVPDEIVDAALEQAATDTGMSPDDFEVDLATQVTWNDGSLGCPQEGRSYIQVLTDGYWVVLVNVGDTYDYRSGTDLQFRRCQNGAPPVTTYVDR